MVVPDLASQVTSRNHNSVDTTVIRSSQPWTRATMLALTSHRTATNTKHPGHARRGSSTPGVAVVHGGPGPGCLRTAGNSAGRCTSWVIVVTEGMLEHSDLAESGTNVPSYAAKVP